MGVLNVTPDSFSDGGLYFEPRKAVERALALVEAGADMIDIGGESSRPAGPYGKGAPVVSLKEELNRTIPIIEAIAPQLNVPISIDTTKAEVARQAIDSGATIVNDISALRFDPGMVPLIAETGVAVVLMHMQGTPSTMQQNPAYDDVVSDILDFLSAQINSAEAMGISQSQIVIDPGLGFGKKYAHNIEILARLSEFHTLGYPLLMGASRKQFTAPQSHPQERLPGSISAIALGAVAGVHIVRVHDVAETVQSLALLDSVCRISL
ncbi:MAG: dihydropteroate synthase [Gemmatimonadota bacterium]|nr:dihydropteroate synthase [Gemmatimonadota bacterium]